MTKQISLNTLWDSAISKDCVFHADEFSYLPEAARRYLEHAIAPGTKLTSAVRLKMHGEIKRKREHSAATPFRPVCGLDGTLALSGLSRRASSSEPRLMMQSIGSLIGHQRAESNDFACHQSNVEQRLGTRGSKRIAYEV